jgi:uncharacterized protein
MKILVDINHPAHVHFFRTFIGLAQKQGDEVIITASKKDIAFELLKEYGLEFVSVGSYGKSTWQKLFNLPIIGLRILMITIKYKPDVLMGIASFRTAQAAWLTGKKSFVFDDTEHSNFEIKLYKPFASRIFTPDCFRKDLGKKQFRYPGYHELAYLHPDIFTSDPKILDELGLSPNEKFVIVRFVGWNAFHDTGRAGFSMEMKCKVISEFSKYAKVFITSEQELPENLKQYKLKISPSRIHHAIAYASLVFGESATMASEAAMLGTPAIFTDDDGRCYTDELQEKFESVFNFTTSTEDQEKALAKGIELLKTDGLKEIWTQKRKVILENKKNVTDLMMHWVFDKS